MENMDIKELSKGLIRLGLEDIAQAFCKKVLKDIEPIIEDINLVFKKNNKDNLSCTMYSSYGFEDIIITLPDYTLRHNTYTEEGDAITEMYKIKDDEFEFEKIN